MPLTNAYQQVKDSVVRVLALNGQVPVSFGSGSVIDSGATVLTCAHCIVPGATVAIADPMPPNQAILGQVVFSDPNVDIALLQFQQSVGKPVKFANSAGCKVGNGSFVVGFPMRVVEQTLFAAHIASITATGLRIDASVNHGNSGGPLFNLNGEQIGVVNAKHGSLSQFLMQIKNAQPMAMVSIAGIDPVKAIQTLIEEMQMNLNLGIGYAIPTATIKPLHATLTKCIP
jgi:S1-C subfamily serine protease